MIISVTEAKELVDFKGWNDAKIERKLKAVELAIRDHTHNNFQVRTIRDECAVMAGQLCGNIPGLKVDDTIQISGSKYNDGLHVVTAIDDLVITTDTELMDEPYALVTKVHYPENVIECAIDMLEWELDGKRNAVKKGVQSETLSRHSVTYVQQTDDNTKSGYPASIMSALKPFMKARF